MDVIRVLCYTCETCGKLFHNKTRLTHHVAVHLDPSQRPVFPCPHKTCSRFYYAKKNVDYHMRVFHEGKKNKQKCHICGKKLSSKQKLKNHLKRHDRMELSETLQSPVSRTTLRQKVMVDIEHVEPELSEEAVIVEVNPLGSKDELCDSDQDEMVWKGIIPSANISVQDPSSFTGEIGSDNIPNDSSLHSEMILVSVKQEYIKEEVSSDIDTYTASLKEEPNTNVMPVGLTPPQEKAHQSFQMEYLQFKVL
ncbi:MDS1 and EVI1 complex locus protein EVI1-A [Anabrus simplex]|uniref:MDS1 and EVI1 complex locus protein EVI1-A n=1 Tax=Anabrus simplex TaxID=316456 RepID=UPI0035A30218